MPRTEDARRELRKQAQQAAKNVGRNWGDLSKEERKPFLDTARSADKKTGKNAGKKDALRATLISDAKAAAEKAGKTWADLSKEQKQSFKKEARSAVKASKPGRAAKQEG